MFKASKPKRKIENLITAVNDDYLQYNYSILIDLIELS
jgi:hypothetical protein